MGERQTTIPQLTRRGFLRIGSAGVSWFSLLPFARPNGISASEKLRVRGTAEYCIFLFQNGGPSQIDTFDFKEGRWTPPDFDLRKVKGGTLKLPYGLFPRLAGKLNDLAIVRSVEAWEVEHSRAQYYMQVAHAISPARRAEMPSLAAIVAYEMESRRKPGDFLPPFVSMNFNDGRRAGVIGSGCLDPKYSPLDLNTKGELGFLVPDTDRERFNSRWNLLQKLDGGQDSDDATRIAAEREYQVYSEGAHRMMITPEIGGILKLEPEERKRYGGNSLGDACVIARNIVAAEAGTRYVVISHPGWDSHKNIYDRNNPANHYAVCAEFDTALGHLLAIGCWIRHSSYAWGNSDARLEISR